MDRCRVSEEELEHDHRNMFMDAMFDPDNLRFKCEACKKGFKLENMYDAEKGICVICAQKDDVKYEWGIE